MSEHIEWAEYLNEEIGWDSELGISDDDLMFIDTLDCEIEDRLLACAYLVKHYEMRATRLRGYILTHMESGFFAKDGTHVGVVESPTFKIVGEIPEEYQKTDLDTGRIWADISAGKDVPGTKRVTRKQLVIT